MPRRLSIARCLAAVLLVLAGAWLPVAAAETDGPQAQVERFHAALLGAMRDERSFDTRARALTAVMAQTFDFSTIARICLGKTWRELDDAQRAEFETVLSELIVATYVDRFDADRGQRFETVEVNVDKPNRSLVRARVVRASGEAVALDYYFRDARVFNVVADGVSDLSLRRADYNAVLKADGYAHLLNDLRRQVAETRANFAEVDG
ncbi:MAG: ABC transporter substrate-binding protein [Pseudomonadota bacterium]